MSDKVPPSKPTATTAAKGSTGGAATTKTAITNGGTKAAHLYNPTSRPPYSRQPYKRRHDNRPRRSYCCCFCCWSILVILVLVLLSAITGTVLYVVYSPQRPSFTLASLRIHRLNLTTAADSSSHLSTLFNLTLSSKNPNSYISFSYDPFVVSCVSSHSDVFLGNGALPAFVSESKNDTTFKGVVVSTSSDLDVDTVNSLRPDLKKRNGFSLKLEMDTRVTVKMGGSKSKRVGIRVTCDGIKGSLPRGKSPSLSNVSGSKCKVDLRMKIWRWSF